MIKFIFLFWSCLLLIHCNSNSKNLVIIPLSPYFKETDGQNTKDAYKYYLVKGYVQSSENHADEMKNFAFRQKDSNFSSFENYQIVFYRESESTNENYKEDQSDLIEWHGNDIVCTVNWSKGKLISIFQYSQGKIISKPDLKEHIKKTGKIFGSISASYQ